MFKLIFNLGQIQSALACATCTFEDKSNYYYVILVAVMTAMPVVLVGAVVLYLRWYRSKYVVDERQKEHLS